MDLATDRRTRLTAVRRRRLLSIAGLLVVLVVVLLQFGEPMRVSSSSMEPTLKSGDQILIATRAYKSHGPARGDLVVFDGPDGPLVKRVAAIAGDEVGIEDGQLVVNARIVPEPAVDQSTVDGMYYGPVTVPSGSVFVLGDNRANSVDSRTLGPVPLDALIGQVRIRLWPSPGDL
ncbi:MAG TPA: signal peptidase I [Kribbella sp.]